MIAYFDTSALIPLLVDEPTSEAAGALWLSATRVVASRVLLPEACSALARALRMGRLDRTEYLSAKDGLTDLVSQIDHIEVTNDVASISCTMTAEHDLRAYDAVHLASASIMRGPELVVVTNDSKLRSAALAEGLNTAKLQ